MRGSWWVLPLLGGCGAWFDGDGGSGARGGALFGACTTDPSPSCPASLMITELLPAPWAGDPAGGEWVELANTGFSTLDLTGTTLTTGSGTHTVGPVTLLPFGRVVLAGSSSGSLNGGLPQVDEVLTVRLDDLADTLTLASPNGTTLDVVAYGASHSSGAQMPVGASLGVDRSAEDPLGNDLAFAWCDAWTPFGAGDFGTPGAANDRCVTPMAFGYAYDGADVDLLLDEVTGSTTLDLTFGPSGRGFSTGNAGSGLFTRTSTADGQRLVFTYDGTGVRYEADRARGTTCFHGGPIVVPPGNPGGFAAGAWTADGCGPPDRDGLYVGEAELTLQLASTGGTDVACVSVDLEILFDAGGTPTILGDGTWTCAGGSAGTLVVEGAIGVDPAASGTLEVGSTLFGAETVTWTGGLTGDTLTGAFTGVYDLGFFSVPFEGSLRASR